MSGPLLPPRPLFPPSAWVLRWHHLLPKEAKVLDVACGHGRHLYWLHAQGHRVTGVDASAEALASTFALAQAGARIIEADIEAGPWPFAGERFDGIVVTNYLWRPLLPTIAESLANGGVLIYETFAAGNETVGKPSRPDFLLQPGELLQACAGLHVVAYENGYLEQPERFVQRIVAIQKEAESPDQPTRHPLSATG